MHVWLLEASEPIPELDAGFRRLRAGMLADALVSRGHSVLWWTSNFDHFGRRPRFPAFKRLELAERLEIALLPAGGYARTTSPSRIVHNRRLRAGLLERAPHEQRRPDVVVACLPPLEFAEAGVRVAAAWDVPVVVDVRDLWPDVYTTVLPAPLRKLALALLATERKRLRGILRTASSIAAVSDAYLDWALRNAGRARRPQDKVFPLGYPRRVRPLRRRASDRPVAAFVGSFGRSYDLMTVVNAGRKLESDGVDLDLVLAGGGDRFEAVRAKASGVSRVKFPGWLAQPEIEDLLGAASIGLLPYVAGAQQSLPNKLFEYWSAGLPVVSSLGEPLAGMLAAEGVGLTYRARDAGDLARSLRSLAADPGLAASMGERAMKLFGRQFAEDVVYDRFVRHVERLVTEPADSGR